MTVEFSASGAIGVLTMNRPPVNAFDTAHVVELNRQLDQIEKSSDLRVLLVRSANGRFSAGADINALSNWAVSETGADDQSAFSSSLQHCFARIAALSIPSIAAVRGFATGGGLELALSCDIRVIANDAKVGLSEVRLGLVPGAGGTQRLTETIGRSHALLLMLTGDLISGEEAERVGIATIAAPDNEVEERAFGLANSIATWPREATVAIKECVAAVGRDGYVRETQHTRDLSRLPDTRELITRFLESRKRD